MLSYLMQLKKNEGILLTYSGLERLKYKKHLIISVSRGKTKSSPYERPYMTMVLIIDGTSEICAHVIGVISVKLSV